MVHRPADSRLLSNLLTHEKDYSKHLSTLLDFSHASLASFSAYASASSPPASHAILAVAGSFAGADDALRRYASSVEVWRDHLKNLKDLEEDVGNVMRDREILVTRLIKASKSQKPTRDSLLLSPAHIPSNSTSSLPLSITSNPSSKLTSAQAELQACEAHLASMERELDERRAGAVLQGLSVRCKAMVECGWAWGEMGKEGLRALGSITDGPLAFPSQMPPSPSQQQSSQFYKPLPDPNQPPSDISTGNSLEPSQSASQMNLPAAYRIDEFTLPTGSSSGHGHNDEIRHPLSRRITEEDENDGEGEESSIEDMGPVQVVDNPRFANASTSAIKDTTGTPRVNRRFSIRGGSMSKSDIGPIYHPPSRPSTAESRMGSRGERKGSFFGSIRGLFRGKDKKDGSNSEAGSEASYAGFGGGAHKGTIGKWRTRTEANVKLVSKRRDSDDEGVGGMMTDPGLGYEYMSTRNKRLSKKGSVVRGRGVVAKREEEWLGGPNLFVRKENERRASTGDGDDEGTIKAGRKRKTSVTKENTKISGEPNGAGELHVVTLSRNSSMKSAASAPPTSQGPAASHPVAKSQPRRSSSVRVSGTGATKTKKRGSLPVNDLGSRMGEGTVSLMSIVEDVTRTNREGWAGSESLTTGMKQIEQINGWKPAASGVKAPKPRTGGMQVPRAPPPVRRETLHNGLPFVTTSTPLELPKAPTSVFAVTSDADKSGVPGGGRTRKSSLPTSGPPGSGSRTTGLPASSSSRPGIPVSRSSMDDSIALRVTRPAKSPLRSALRTSRSPSPLTGPSASTLTLTPGPSIPNGITPVPKRDETDDNSSTSSYETGHEAFDESVNGYNEEDHPPPPPPPPPPPHEKEDSDISGASTSTPTYPVASSSAAALSNPNTASQIRKSVRVSLHPTFSPTPPAFEEDDDDGGYTWDSGDKRRRRSSSSGGGGGGGGSKAGKEEVVRDIWEDSSEEDEEYSRARRLLGRAARRSHEKGKTRARP